MERDSRDILASNPLLRTPGRGAGGNPSGRFESVKRELDVSDYGWWDLDEQPSLQTEFFTDSTRQILAHNSSPDIPFEVSMNPYRGCEHGCAYCYARPTHEYFGLSAGLDFESKIFVKINAPELLRQELMARKWHPQCIAFSGVTDCYQPAERRYQLTRRCLQTLAEFQNPVSVITKNALVVRDVDILSELARHQCAVVFISVTSLDAELARDLEPRTSSPASRLRAIEELSRAGIPVGVNVAPVIPGLTDQELPNILKAAAKAGAKRAGFTPLRLPHSVAQIFADWLNRVRPLKAPKVLQLICDMRNGQLNDPSFGSRMRGSGAWAQNLAHVFEVFTKRYGLNQQPVSLSTEYFQRPGDQLSLFE